MVFLKELAKSILALLWSRRGYKFFIKDWVSLGDLSGCREVLATMRFTRNLEPVALQLPPAKRLLVLAPHPDDETLGAGGTLIRSIKSGAVAKTVYVTSGRASLAKAMEEEARRVSASVGYEAEFLGYPLNDIPIGSEAQERVAECINRFDPQIVFIPFLLDDHDDHRRVNHLLYLADKQGLLRSKYEFWAFQVYSTVIPNVVVDITDVAEEKAVTVNLWSSQKESRDWAHYILGMNAFNSRFLKKPGQNYVESFLVLPSEEYFSLCEVYFEKRGPKAYYHSNYLRVRKTE
jgi:LmbE family N-acetylglucosaminyl deacetylase